MKNMGHAISLAAILAALLAAAPLRAEEVQIEHDGLVLNGNLELAEGKAISDGVILMTHALLQHNRMETIRSFQALFREQGYSSLAITFGTGVSDRRGPYDCSVPHDHSPQDNVAEIGRWVAWLKERGATEIVLAAHSNSANELGYYARNNDEQAIRKLVYFAPGTGRFQGVALKDETYFAQYRVKADDVRARAQALAEAGKGDEMMDNVDFLFCAKARATANTFLGYYRADSIVRPPVPGFANQQVKPLLVVAGGNDDVAPDLLEKIQPHVDGEKLRLVVVEGCGHFFRELCGDDAIEAAVRFIEE